MSDYVEMNKKTWNRKAELHLDSGFYDVAGFKKGNSPLSKIDTDLLGDISGKKILHLQCHFGMDTLQLQRMGAKVTGLDLSDSAIKQAQELNDELGLKAKFVCCNLYDIHDHIDEQFDMVFTTYGTIGWLPDLDKWAAIISKYLKPGGTLTFIEFHPVVWMFDYNFEKVEYRYFKTDPIIEEETGSYGAKDSKEKFQTTSWNHSIAEVLTSLIDHGLEITGFSEYDYSPYNCFNGTKQLGHMNYIIEKHGHKLPMVYSVLAKKK